MFQSMITCREFNVLFSIFRKTPTSSANTAAENALFKHWKMTDFDVELPYKTAATGRKPDNILCDRNGGVIGSRVEGSNPAASNNGVSLSSPSNILGMDKSTLKVHLPDGSFNVVRFGDATDIKVSS